VDRLAALVQRVQPEELGLARVQPGLRVIPVLLEILAEPAQQAVRVELVPLEILGVSARLVQQDKPVRRGRQVPLGRPGAQERPGALDPRERKEIPVEPDQLDRLARKGTRATLEEPEQQETRAALAARETLETREQPVQAQPTQFCKACSTRRAAPSQDRLALRRSGSRWWVAVAPEAVQLGHRLEAVEAAEPERFARTCPLPSLQGLATP
jgi:hypothetical protein